MNCSGALMTITGNDAKGLRTESVTDLGAAWLSLSIDYKNVI